MANLVDGKKEKSVSFDDLLVELGDFGRYQKTAYFLLFIPTIFSAMQKQAWVFLGAKAPHRCRVRQELLVDQILTLRSLG